MSLKFALGPLTVVMLLAFSGLAAEADPTLTAPASLSAQAVSSNQINLTWVDTNTSESGYQIERSVTPTSGFVLIATTGKSATSYLDTRAASGTNYYRARAVTPSGAISPYSNVASAVASATTVDATPPTVPTLTVSAANCSQINLSWTASTDNPGGSGLK